jgi:hypothetical protein
MREVIESWHFYSMLPLQFLLLAALHVNGGKKTSGVHEMLPALDLVCTPLPQISDYLCDND